MRRNSRRARWLVLLFAGMVLALAAMASSASAALKVTWMQGYVAPATPANLDKVGVIKVGPRTAKNVLVLEPGTSSGGGYFVPLAKWVVSNVRGWQVWSVERRENLLEDQSMLNRAKAGKATAKQMFDYYLGWLTDPSITNHLQPIPDSSVGLRPAVGYGRRGRGPAPRHRGGAKAAAAGSCSAATPSGVRSLPPMPPGTSTAKLAPTTWPDLCTTTAAAAGLR